MQKTSGRLAFYIILIGEFLNLHLTKENRTQNNKPRITIARIKKEDAPNTYKAVEIVQAACTSADTAEYEKQVLELRIIG